jgi:hypothetical protein
MGEPYKLQLPTVDDFAHILATYGRNTYMWGLDLRRAYRQIRLDPLDWPLICITWDNLFYSNISVAFGIRHGAAFTQRLSQAVCDILGAENILTLPYIDDFLGGHPSLDLANAAFDRSLRLFAELGLDLNPSKCTSPTTQITWIGVTFDSAAMVMHIPTQVITDTTLLVSNWLNKISATRHELQVLLGKLFHAGKCCLAARLFVGRMLATLRSTLPSGSSTLSDSFRADLRWWRDMLPTYNGRLLIQRVRPTVAIYLEVSEYTFTVQTDTLTSTAIIPPSIATNDHKWAHRECYAILVALTLWGSQWTESELLVFCTDPSKLQVLVHGRSHNAAILNIARRIWLITAAHDISITPRLQAVTHHQPTTVVMAPTFAWL